LGSASLRGRTLPPGKTRYPLYRRLGGPQGRSGQVRKISPHRDSIPDRPARRQSLYRLRYPAPVKDVPMIYVHFIIFAITVSEKIYKVLLSCRPSNIIHIAFCKLALLQPSLSGYIISIKFNICHLW